MASKRDLMDGFGWLKIYDGLIISKLECFLKCVLIFSSMADGAILGIIISEFQITHICEQWLCVLS